MQGRDSQNSGDPGFPSALTVAHRPTVPGQVVPEAFPFRAALERADGREYRESFPDPACQDSGIPSVRPPGPSGPLRGRRPSRQVRRAYEPVSSRSPHGTFSRCGQSPGYCRFPDGARLPARSDPSGCARSVFPGHLRFRPVRPRFPLCRGRQGTVRPPPGARRQSDGRSG